MPSSYTYRVAHISDLHLAPLPEIKWRDLLNKRFTGWLNWKFGRGSHFDKDLFEKTIDIIHQNKPDHIICTGDICNLGLPDEWRAARNILEKIAPENKISFVPGNHDAYLKQSLQGLLLELGNYAPPQFPYVRETGKLVFIGLSSAIATPPFFATGALGNTQREELLRLLKPYKDPNYYKVIFLHHPPLPELGIKRKELLDGNILKEILGEEHIRLVLYGHNHISRITPYPLNNQQTGYAIGAAALALRSHNPLKNPGFNFLDFIIEPNKSIKVTLNQYSWDKDTLKQRITDLSR